MIWSAIEPYIWKAAAVVGPIATFFVGKTRRTALDNKAIEEAAGEHLDNVDHGLDIYKKIMSTLEANLNAANTRLNSAQADYGELKAEMGQLEQKERECQEEKILLKEENLKFYRKINTCTIDCKLKNKQ